MNTLLNPESSIRLQYRCRCIIQMQIHCQRDGSMPTAKSDLSSRTNLLVNEFTNLLMDQQTF